MHEPEIQAADLLLIHGNGVKDPGMIPEMVRKTQAVKGYTPVQFRITWLIETSNGDCDASRTAPERSGASGSAKQSAP